MHEKLMDIQNSFWRAYKDYLQSGDRNGYESSADAIVFKYQNSDMYHFCEGLKSSWKVVVNYDGDLKEIHVDVSEIQRMYWAAYKNFMATKNMRKWNEDMKRIAKRCGANKAICRFGKYLLYIWVPIISRIKEMG